MSNDSFTFLNGKLKLSKNEILDKIHHKNKDIVLLSGTLVEGIGNIHSDLDVYVFTESFPEKNKVGVHSYYKINENNQCKNYYDYILNSSLGIDVTYWTFNQLEALSKNLEGLYQKAYKSPRKLKETFGYEEDDLIHKIQHGIPLNNEQKYHDLFSLFPKDKFNFYKYRYFTGGYPGFKDILGSWESGDFDTCLLMSRIYFISQVMGFIHLCGNTNFKQKWILKNLQKLPKSYQYLSEAIYNWLHADYSVKEHQKEGVIQGLRLISAIFKESRSILNRNPLYSSAENILKLIDIEYGLEPFYDSETIREYKFRRMIYGGNNHCCEDFLSNEIE